MKIEMTLIPLPVTLKAGTIGTLARKILEESDQAKILGITSRGIFLLVPSNKVVFLSFETFRSPLTLNLPARPHLSHTRPGMPADLRPGEVVSPEDKLSIRYTDAETWAPSSPPAKLLSKTEVSQNFRTIAAHLDGSAGFAPILQVIAGRVEPQFIPLELQLPFEILKSVLEGPSSRPGVAPLASLLGFGRGLTPSGDDCITGFLLATRRWFPAIQPDAGAGWVEQAYRKTTTLSANIIEAAAAGLADERLIAVTDALFCGTPSPETAARQALSYGSSSGIDALVGMYLSSMFL